MDVEQSKDRRVVPVEFTEHTPKFSGPIESVALIFAMEGEARPIIEKLGLEEIEEVDGAEFGIRAFHGKVGGLNVYLSLNGQDPVHKVDNVGTEIAALNAHFAINEYKPDLVVNAGTAGGFRQQGTKIADVFVSDEQVVQHDHRIPLPGFDEYGRGGYQVVPLATLPEDLGVKRGIISTGNSLDATDRDLELISELSASVKEMEAAAIARVAERNGTAFLALKAITDFADSPENHEAFVENYTAACEQLGASLLGLLQYLGEGKTFEELQGN